MNYRRSGRLRRPGLVDLGVALLVFAAVYTLVRVGAGVAPAAGGAPAPAITLAPAALAYYSLRSLIRMSTAFVLSILFSILYGYAAAYNRRAEQVLIPLLDVLQSIPVLGFLSASLPALTAFFPGSLGAELSAVFAIFTSQAWNLTFAFYQSLRGVPQELRLVARLYRLNWWQRAFRLELPASLVPLVWNGMMAFGGGWFFLAASEAITVQNRDILLPGLGSYLAVALRRSDGRAAGYAVAAMIVVIVGLDQILWRPLVAWASQSHSSLVLRMLRRSLIVDRVEAWLLEPLLRRIDRAGARLAERGRAAPQAAPWWGRFRRYAVYVATALLTLWGARTAWHAALLIAGMGVSQVMQVAGLGLLTLLRVLAAVALGALWTVPAGVALGLNPKIAAMAQPLVQVAAAFPANMLFPFVTALYLRLGVSFEWGSVLLLTLGTQWYILINVIAGAMRVPRELLETGEVFRLSRLSRWRYLIAPAILPSFLTGCITAAGGAWNASIVAEVVTWGPESLVATGLGSYITAVTREGFGPGIVWGLIVMSLLVVGLNQVLWRRLYHLAESRFQAEV